LESLAEYNGALYRFLSSIHISIKIILKLGLFMDTNNFLKQMLLMGIGTTSFVADKIREVSEEWVKEGRLNPDQAKAFVEDLMQQLRTDPTDWENQFQRQFRNIMQDFGVARQPEIDELRGRIDRLERQVRDLENKSWR
jgi:polyhydroxyalkanoate synthesis regulator phasin